MRCIILQIYNYKMSSEISINICKILNWCLTNSNIKLEVAFYTLKNHNYLAHKSTVGYFNSQALILNTSFRINYYPAEHIILCKISDVRDKSDVKLIGQIEIDLNLLAERKTLFVPFQDHDKVLEVKLYENKKETMDSQKSINDEQAEEKREEFLQERFDFLDKLTEHETQLKKNFSEKVYNLLKQLKNKNHQNKNERDVPKSHIDRQGKGKNELQFRNRLGQAKKKTEIYQMEPRNNKISPNKHKLDHQLLIHSVHAKPEKMETPEQQRFKGESPNTKAGLWQVRDDLRADRHQIKVQTNVGNGFNNSPAFGGIINPYLNQFTTY